MTPQPDDRSPERRALDERIAAEPPLAPLELPPDPATSPLAAHAGRHRGRSVTVAGVVENGVVRPIDPTVRLPERSRVIILASEAT